MRILVTGGGTGGHVAPALAVIQALQKRARETGSAAPIFQYIGSADGIEAKLASEAGVEFVAVASGKLRRSARGPLGLLTRKNVIDLWKIPLGMVQSYFAVKRFHPDVMFATGGYVSIPPVVAAALLRVPILTHEQTVTIGLANKIAGSFATKIALSFEGAVDDLPRRLRSKTIVTGNPVREAIFSGTRKSATGRFGFDRADDALPTLYVTGGAQGSSVINRAVEAIMPNLLAQCRIVHQCGRQPKSAGQDFDRLREAAERLPPALRRRYYVTQFVDSDAIGDAYALADVVLGRSGAGTVTETCALGKAAVFVPLEPTGGDEQVRNARRSVEARAAIIVPQAECDGAHILANVSPLLSHPPLRQAMAKAALTMARPRAAEDIVDALLALV